VPCPCSASWIKLERSSGAAATAAGAFAVCQPLGNAMRKSRSGWRKTVPSKTPADGSASTTSPSIFAKNAPRSAAIGRGAARCNVFARALALCTRSGVAGCVSRKLG
jgi:hypothetical protein